MRVEKPTAESLGTVKGWCSTPKPMLQTELSVVLPEHSFRLPEPRERTNPISRHYKRPLERENECKGCDHQRRAHSDSASPGGWGGGDDLLEGL